MSTIQVQITRLDPDVPIPSYAHPGDAAVDLVTTSNVVLRPGERTLVGTGIALALPEGYAAFIQPRSGLAARAGLSVVNTPGLIDSGYRGEIRVNLVNHDLHAPLELSRGDRIAQMVIQRVEKAIFVEVAGLDVTERNTRGHGSTGGHTTLVGQAAAQGGRGN